MAKIEPTQRADVGLINLWLKEKSEMLFKKNMLLEIMEQQGLVQYNVKTKAFEWEIKYKRREPQAVDVSQPFTSFPQTNTRGTAELPMRSYFMGESRLKIEKLMTGTPEDRIKQIGNLAKEAMEDFREGFPALLWGNGNETGSNAMHGLTTLQGTTSAVISDGVVGDVTGSYAGHSMQFGIWGGGWDAPSGQAFPYGQGDYQYHTWTPWLWDVTNTKWGGDTADWVGNWRNVITTAMDQMGAKNKIRPDIIILNTSWLTDMKNSLVTNERFEITQNSLATKLGYGTVTFEGIEITDDYDCPADTGVLVTYDQLGLKSMQPQLIMLEEDYDIESRSDRMALDFYGNMQVKSPSAIGFMQNIS